MMDVTCLLAFYTNFNFNLEWSKRVTRRNVTIAAMFIYSNMLVHIQNMVVTRTHVCSFDL